MKILLVDQIAKVNYKYSYSLAKAINEIGHDIVLAVDQKQEEEGCQCRKLNLFNTDEKNIGKLSKLKNYITSYKTILQELKSGNYQILHTQWVIFSPVDVYFLYKIKKKTGIRLIVTIHDILPFNQKFYDYYFHKKLYIAADKIIVQAENNVNRFRELFQNLSGKEVMIPHGHFLNYAEPLDKISARKYLNIPEDKTVFLFFGQIKKVKGVGILLKAFSKIYKSYPDILLVIAGSVWKDDFSQYQKIIDENNMRNCVRTDIRYIPDEEVKYYYSCADCCVLPYLDVYQSGVIQLAYAYKKPVIATKIGAFLEVVLDGQSGFLCEPNNADSLAQTMERAYKQKSNYRKMGQAGYDFIKEKYSWKKIARQICSLYTDKQIT